MTDPEAKSNLHFEGPAGLDLEEGLRLLKAFMAISNVQARSAALEYIERLAAAEHGDDLI